METEYLFLRTNVISFNFTNVFMCFISIHSYPLLAKKSTFNSQLLYFRVNFSDLGNGNTFTHNYENVICNCQQAYADPIIDSKKKLGVES